MRKSSSELKDDVHLWRVNLLQPEAKVQELESWLSPTERARALRYHFESDRRRFTVAKAALRSILSNLLAKQPRSITFTAGPYGKPRLLGEALQFNVSHSSETAVIAVASNREVGVDVEHLRPVDDALSIAARFFSQEESLKLNSLTENADIMNAFLTCWTRKEAFVKATGQGITYPLNEFSVTFLAHEEPKLLLPNVDSHRWTLRDLNVGPKYCGALVYEEPVNDPPARLHSWQWEPEFKLMIRGEGSASTWEA